MFPESRCTGMVNHTPGLTPHQSAFGGQLLTVSNNWLQIRNLNFRDKFIKDFCFYPLTRGRFHREMKYPDKIIIFECMPTILFIYGWRLFFYSNEGLEPMHVHAEKGDMECKFWLLIEEVEIREEFAFNLNPASKKEIKKIIYQHFDLIVDAWNKHFKK